MESLAISVGSLIQKVADLLQLYKKLKEFVGIEEKMEKLKELSIIILMAIQDVELACSMRDDAVKKLLRKLKHLAYDLEDAVDVYDTEALRKQRSSDWCRPVRDFFSSNNNQLVFMCRINGMIKEATKNLDSILLQNSILENLRRGTSQIPQSTYREIHPQNSLAVIGRETEKKMIVNMLTDDEESSNGTVMKVIALIGMGGVGKTTLARQVFKDERVEAYFGKLNTYWKVVGREFDPTEIMKYILQLASSASDNISDPELVRRELEKALSEKRFLLVLDDVWNENALKWRELEATLSCGARGSKVLVTTRSREISSIMGSFKTHQVQQLSEDDCLSLFRRIAFGDEEPNDNLMKIARKIVKKCDGVPLAAISLGSMLHGTRNEIYWSRVLNSEIWQLVDEVQKFLAVLKLSYDALPPRSKKCFTFGSLFPKNCVMKRDNLIKLWIANGFVCSEGNFDAETIGDRVFDDLLLRSFFLSAPSEECDDGRHVTECTMHDLMHDLARSISEDEYYTREDYLTKNIQKRTYYLNIDDGEKLARIPKAEFKKSLRLRTLQLGGPPRSYLMVPKQLQLICSEFKFLRVLDLRFNYIDEVPSSVGNLIHLRYLDLSQNSIKVLPDTIALLQNLQYLNLQDNWGLQELPNNLRNMQSLKCLAYESHNLTHMPPGLSQLTSLQSLSCFIAEGKTGSCSITDLEHLKLRGEMEIRFYRNNRNYSCGGRKILKNKDFRQLSLSFNYFHSNGFSTLPDHFRNPGLRRSKIAHYWRLQFPTRLMKNDVSRLADLCPNTSLKKLKISQYWSRQFPIWLMESQLSNLVEVILKYCCFCEHIPPLGNLQFLRSPSSGFPALQQFELISMTNLEGWSESDGADELFPLLKRLEIGNCPKLTTMPRLPRIEQLTLFNCSENLLSCVGRLTSLSHLILEDMKGMTSLPSGCLRNLTSLMKLEILSCNELQSLPMDEMQHLTMVHSLSIEKCNKLCLNNLDSGTVLQPEILVQILNSLREFNIQICGKNVNLSGQLQHLHTLQQLWISGSHRFSYTLKYMTSTKLSICCCDYLESLMPAAAPSTSVLQVLHICNIPNLTTLPEWLQHLGSLFALSIINCSQLESLPRGLQHLRLLYSLEIRGCSLQLKSRCKRETGEDWPNISHLQHTRISSKVVDGFPIWDPKYPYVPSDTDTEGGDGNSKSISKKKRKRKRESMKGESSARRQRSGR